MFFVNLKDFPDKDASLERVLAEEQKSVALRICCVETILFMPTAGSGTRFHSHHSSASSSLSKLMPLHQEVGVGKHAQSLWYSTLKYTIRQIDVHTGALLQESKPRAFTLSGVVRVTFFTKPSLYPSAGYCNCMQIWFMLPGAWLRVESIHV